jgi:hypothetical protein
MAAPMPHREAIPIRMKSHCDPATATMPRCHIDPIVSLKYLNFIRQIYDVYLYVMKDPEKCYACSTTLSQPC